jgi:hypothetical protein
MLYICSEDSAIVKKSKARTPSFLKSKIIKEGLNGAHVGGGQFIGTFKNQYYLQSD